MSGLRRSLRVSGALLVTLGLVSLGWLLTPGGAAMHQREVLAAGGGTLSDTLHLVSGAVGSLFCFLIIGFGSTAFGARFRRYSIVTALVMLVFGALAGSQAPSVAANQPTPWLGVTERIMFASFLLWFAALSAALLRAAVQQPRTDVGLPGRRTDAS